MSEIKSKFRFKIDIARFFDHIDHTILKKLIRKKVKNKKTLRLIDLIIDSFSLSKRKGIPLGNVTSQVFANIYLHELDIFIKHHLKEPFYLRFCDDFIVVSNHADHLKKLIPLIGEFLSKRLKLELHPRKTILSKLSQGIDFLGYKLFPHHTLLRTTTKRRLKKRLQAGLRDFSKEKISGQTLHQRLQSYLGILSHANEHTLSTHLKNAYWVKREP
ncbi:RNA-directed DNA polymerase [Candidatus Neptunochlamydia vexilliferae]|uniref:RNA-directed DNA polymerase n=1 Tax=Candidatus Neptunichlamydia vexilliferae TaxID=1651774 RepID=UPI0018914C36|nr:RNA-directed DNA polymerase [Candidatus Neptunochlamydia vexilliferae]